MHIGVYRVQNNSFDADGSRVTKYTSSKTGLRMIHADVEGPMVQGFIVLSSETAPLDGDGLPHTLEHLVFMGSEDYPYKGKYKQPPEPTKCSHSFLAS